MQEQTKTDAQKYSEAISGRIAETCYQMIADLTGTEQVIGEQGKELVANHETGETMLLLSFPYTGWDNVSASPVEVEEFIESFAHLTVFSMNMALLFRKRFDDNAKLVTDIVGRTVTMYEDEIVVEMSWSNNVEGDSYEED